jgi:protein associated with RNAse G/E
LNTSNVENDENIIIQTTKHNIINFDGKKLYETNKFFLLFFSINQNFVLMKSKSEKFAQTKLLGNRKEI